MAAPESPGLVASLRRLLGTLLETAQVRLDLIAVEIELEKQRLLTVLLLSVLGLMLACIGLVLAAALLVLAVAPAYRLAVLAVRSASSAGEPAEAFRAAAAELDQLGEPDGPALTVRQGPACPGGQVTLSYLQQLLSAP